MTESNVPPTDTSAAPPPPAPGAASGSVMSYAAAPGGYDGPPPSKDDTNMGLLLYILGIVTNFIGPLIIWLTKKDQSKFLNDQGKEVLNFQITIAISWVVAGILAVITLGIGLILFPVIVVCYLVFMIMGAIKVNKGIAYRFPFALRLLK